LLATLERLENQVWEKFKNKDKAGYTAIVTDDYTAVATDGKGERDLKGTLDSFKDITIGSYALSEFRLTMLGPSAALLRYNASAKYSIGTQQFSGRLAVGDIWVKTRRSFEIDPLPGDGDEVTEHKIAGVRRAGDATNVVRAHGNPIRVEMR
jgi:hypothetical protein